MEEVKGYRADDKLTWLIRRVPELMFRFGLEMNGLSLLQMGEFYSLR